MRAKYILGTATILLAFLVGCEETLVEKSTGDLPYLYIDSFNKREPNTILSSSVNPDGTLNIYAAPPAISGGAYTRTLLNQRGGLISIDTLRSYIYPWLVEETHQFLVGNVGIDDFPALSSFVDAQNNLIIFTPMTWSMTSPNAPPDIYSHISKFDANLKHVVTKAITIYAPNVYAPGAGRLFATSDGGYIARGTVYWSTEDITKDTLYITKLTPELNVEYTIKSCLANFFPTVGQAQGSEDFPNTFIESNGKYYLVLANGTFVPSLFEVNASGLFQKQNNGFKPFGKDYAVTLSNNHVLTTSTGNSGSILLHSPDLSTAQFVGPLAESSNGYSLMQTFEFFLVGTRVYFSSQMYNYETNKTKLRLGYVDPTQNFAIGYKDFDFGLEVFGAHSTQLPDGGFSVLVWVFGNEYLSTDLLQFKVDSRLNLVP